MVAVALEAVSYVGNLNINLTLVEDVVRKDVVFAVGGTGFQFDAGNALEEKAAVDQEVIAVDELNALARIVVVERAMANDYMIAGRSVQGGQGAHDINV